VIKPTDEYHPKSIKNISNTKQLKDAFEWASAFSSKGIVYVDADTLAGTNDLKKGPNEDAADGAVAIVLAYPILICWADVVKTVLLDPIETSPVSINFPEPFMSIASIFKTSPP
jgi:hypothetical protein